MPLPYALRESNRAIFDRLVTSPDAARWKLACAGCRTWAHNYRANDAARWLAGHTRCAHVTVTRLDPVTPIVNRLANKGA